MFLIERDGRIYMFNTLEILTDVLSVSRQEQMLMYSEMAVERINTKEGKIIKDRSGVFNHSCVHKIGDLLKIIEFMHTLG